MALEVRHPAGGSGNALHSGPQRDPSARHSGSGSGRRRATQRLGRLGNRRLAAANHSPRLGELGPPSGLFKLEPFWVRIPIKMRRHHGFAMKPWPVLLPHEFFHALHTNSRMEVLLGPSGVDGIAAFWLGVQNEPWFQQHPAQAERQRLPFTCPVRIHGDEGSTQKRAQLMIINWVSALVHGPSLKTRLLFTVVPASLYVKRGGRNATLQALYKVLAWSFRALYTGRWPSQGLPGFVLRGPSGQPLAGTWRCAFVGMKGDAKFVRETMHWRRHWGARHMCHECFASRTDAEFSYLQLGPEAAWRYTTEGHEDWLRNTLVQERSPLLEIPGFRKELIYHDLLHTVCLGIGQDFLGSALVELASRGAFGQPRSDLDRLDAALHEALLQFKRWCAHEDLGAPSFDHISATSLGVPDYPELPGKGSDCRKMLSWLPFVATTFALGDGKLWEKTLATCSWAMAKFWAIVDRGDMFLSTSDAHEACEAGELYLQMYLWLSCEALGRGVLRFKVRPKFHAFHHQCLRLKLSNLNPRFVSCWADEDYVGRITRASKRSHASAMWTSTLQRYLVLCAAQWFPPGLEQRAVGHCRRRP